MFRPVVDSLRNTPRSPPCAGFFVSGLPPMISRRSFRPYRSLRQLLQDPVCCTTARRRRRGRGLLEKGPCRNLAVNSLQIPKADQSLCRSEFIREGVLSDTPPPITTHKSQPSLLRDSATSQTGRHLLQVIHNFVGANLFAKRPPAHINHRLTPPADQIPANPY